MMLPILISLSLAPGLYFFCATAGLAAIAAPISAAAERTNQFFAIFRFLPLVYGPCSGALLSGRPCPVSTHILTRRRAQRQNAWTAPETPVGIIYMKAIRKTP